MGRPRARQGDSRGVGANVACLQALVRPRTFRNYEELWRSLVRPRWADVSLAAVTYAEVVVWQAELNNRSMSPARVGQALLVLKQLLDLAVKDGRLARNVARDVKPPRPRKAEQRFLSHRELDALATECGRTHASYRTMVLLLGYTGLRWGEVRALRVRRLDLLRSRVEISENIPHNCDESEGSTPKSHKRRVVPFPRFLTADLAFVVAGKKPHDLVFTNLSGGLLDARNFRRRVFDPAVSALGLAPFTPHHLRDTAASLAVSAGANVKAIQRMLGHASAAMTLDVYAGLFSDDLDAVAQRLNQAATAVAQASSHRPVEPVVDLTRTRRSTAVAD